MNKKDGQRKKEKRKNKEDESIRRGWEVLNFFFFSFSNLVLAVVGCVVHSTGEHGSYTNIEQEKSNLAWGSQLHFEGMRRHGCRD